MFYKETQRQRLVGSRSVDGEPRGSFDCGKRELGNKCAALTTAHNLSR